MKLGCCKSNKSVIAVWSLALIISAICVPVVVSATDSVEIPTDDKGLPLWQIVEWTDFPIHMELADRQALDNLLNTVSIDSYNYEQFEVVYDGPKSSHILFKPRVTEAEAAALTAAGYKFERVEDLDKLGRQETERVWAERAAKGGEKFQVGKINYYPTVAEIGEILGDIETAYPTMARRFTWGQSVQGRDLWGIVISDNVDQTEAEPEVRLSSTMHGDEVVGIVMALNFAQYLTENYGQPGYDDVTNLVDNYEIHLMPLHNPDGMVLDQRSNANGVDLNRNFDLPAGTHSSVELENVNYANYANNHNFVLSYNSHGGALVMNYPWDYTYTLAPDDAALIKLSLEYTTYNTPMYNGNWPQGITNGAAWYITTGCVQDWVYDQTDGIDITLEVSNTKWPSASTLPGFWEDNRESMMHYVKAARYGINGVVTGSDTSLPLDAEITIAGNAMNTHTDPAHGDYYKILDTGTYDVTVSAYGYITKTVYDVSTTWGTPTVLDVELDPVAHGDISGVVLGMSGEGLTAQINVYTRPGDEYVTSLSSSAAGGGAYSGSLVYGEYRIEATSNDHFTENQDVTIGATPVVANFQLGGIEEVVVFFDDFENGVAKWSGDWGIAIPAEGYNSDNCLNDSPGTEYDNYANTAMTIAQSIDLSEAMAAEISFRAKWSIENSWDCVFFEVSDDGTDWDIVGTQHTNSASGQGAQVPRYAEIFDDNKANWVLNTVDLEPWLGKEDVQFRFRLASDSSEVRSGFFLDDVEIKVTRAQSGATAIPEAVVLIAGVKAYPNPFNPQTSINLTNPRSGNVQLSVYDVQGRRVRTLVSGHMTAGEHQVVWDGRGDTGGQAASGVYFAKMIAGTDVATTKLMLVK